MKRLFRALGGILICAILFLSIRLFSVLPADNADYIERKYSSWNGVLQACVCSRWQAGGSFIRWLNRCVTDFEKAHDGVYIEFIDCEEAELGGVFEIYSPDLFFFSPGVITDESAAEYAQAVCMGGYAWAYNRKLIDAESLCVQSQPMLQPDSAACCYSAATIALSQLNGAAEPIQPTREMDIGLAANTSDAGALSKFANGEAAYLAVSTKDIAYLQRLAESGRGCDWAIFCPNARAFTDQLLYMMLPTYLPDDGRREILYAFADYLLTEKCQSELRSIGAIPVCGESIYPAQSPFSQIEVHLKSEPPIMPQIFSEYSSADCADIVRTFFNGDASSAEAIDSILARRKNKSG